MILSIFKAALLLVASFVLITFAVLLFDDLLELIEDAISKTVDKSGSERN